MDGSTVALLKIAFTFQCCLLEPPIALARFLSFYASSTIRRVLDFVFLLTNLQQNKPSLNIPWNDKYRTVKYKLMYKF